MYQQPQKQMPLLRSYEKRRFPEKVIGTPRVTNSIADGEQQQIQVCCGTVRSSCAKPKISEKIVFYPEFFRLTLKRLLTGRTPVRLRPCGKTYRESVRQNDEVGETPTRKLFCDMARWIIVGRLRLQGVTLNRLLKQKECTTRRTIGSRVEDLSYSHG